MTFKLDSGDSDHLVNDKWCFTEINKLKSAVEIHVAKDKQLLRAEYSGAICGTANRGIQITIKAVLYKYIPQLRYNLLYVRKLENAGAEVKLGRDKAMIFKNNELLATAFLRSNLYEVKSNEIEN